MKELKRELKEFEHTFQQQEGRKPDKSDIASNRDIGMFINLLANFIFHFYYFFIV